MRRRSMRKTLLLIAVALLASLWSAAAGAGVVIDQETEIQSGGAPVKENSTVTVEGDKQKVVSNGHTVVIDANKGVMDILDPATKSYNEITLPPTGPLGQMMQTMGGMNLNYQKTGGHQTILGFKCDEYTGSAKMPMGDSTMKGCF